MKLMKPMFLALIIWWLNLNQVLGAYGKGTVKINLDMPQKNLPPQTLKSEPKAEDYNLLFRGFFEADFFGTSEEDSCIKLSELFKAETSNSLYAKLKLREKRFDGSITVAPMEYNDQQIVRVSARICYKRFLSRILRIEHYSVVFSKKGVFKSVVREMTWEVEL
jgi:hypothetical protein